MLSSFPITNADLTFALISCLVYTTFVPNVIIQKISSKPAFAELIAKAWYVLAIEGSTPDIGRRRENFVRLALKYDMGLEIEESEREMDRQLDFYYVDGGKRYPYSFKSTCSHTLKVAWNGNVTQDRLDRFEFTTPILMLYESNSKIRSHGFYLFEVADLNRVKSELGDNFWSLPRQETNPRGFGFTGQALSRLLEIAKNKGNFVKVDFRPVQIDKDKFWSQWYESIKKVAEESVHEHPQSSDDTLPLFPSQS